MLNLASIQTTIVIAPSALEGPPTSWRVPKVAATRWNGGKPSPTEYSGKIPLITLGSWLTSRTECWNTLKIHNFGWILWIWSSWSSTSWKQDPPCRSLSTRGASNPAQTNLKLQVSRESQEAPQSYWCLAGNEGMIHNIIIPFPHSNPFPTKHQ